MRKIVLTYGLIGGLTISILMSFSMWLCMDQPNFEGSMVLGYAIMLVSMAFIFVGVNATAIANWGESFRFGRRFGQDYLLPFLHPRFTLSPG